MSMFSGSRNPKGAIILDCGGCGSHFQNDRHEFSMTNISANNIDRKFICVSLSLLSRSQNENLVNILVCGVCGSHFQNGRHEFPMSHISANIIDRKLIIVSYVYVVRVKESKCGNYIGLWGLWQLFSKWRP